MTSKKVLFINQAITPYVPETEMSLKGKDVPQAIQDMGNEIRVFLPKWGNINERRNQLHEVIRLSGMNIIIDDTDHPLIIKVATLQPAHIQVYFIDNEDYFQKRLTIGDKKGIEYSDNYERAIFYARSVLETIKKLKWYPDVIHCQGWISAFAPFFIKTVYRKGAPLARTKVVYSLYDVPLTKAMPDNIKSCLAFRNVTSEEIDGNKLELKSPIDLAKMAILFSDGVIAGQENTNSELLEFARAKKKPILNYQKGDDIAEKYAEFYEKVLS